MAASVSACLTARSIVLRRRSRSSALRFSSLDCGSSLALPSPPGRTSLDPRSPGPTLRVADGVRVPRRVETWTAAVAERASARGGAVTTCASTRRSPLLEGQRVDPCLEETTPGLQQFAGWWQPSVEPIEVVHEQQDRWTAEAPRQHHLPPLADPPGGCPGDLADPVPPSPHSHGPAPADLMTEGIGHHLAGRSTPHPEPAVLEVTDDVTYRHRPVRLEERRQHRVAQISSPPLHAGRSTTRVSQSSGRRRRPYQLST